MDLLSYQLLEEKHYEGYLLKEAPERLLQFGEGNFLRAFVEHFVDVMNEKANFNCKAVLVQPRAHRAGTRDMKQLLNDQEGLYTLYLRGMEKGKKVNRKRIISCVSRCLNSHADYEEVLACAANPDLRFIVCNTTEAGIVYDPTCQFDDAPAASFPGKLTQFLYRRFRLFGGEPGKGFLILACELIDNNGHKLASCVERYARQWGLEEAFLDWLSTENLFCSTLVDRIVTGYPGREAEVLNKENGYEDRAMVAGEIFASWVIEGPASIAGEIPFQKAGLPILLTSDHAPYKQRKVRILNGAHTAMVPGAYLAGQDIVRDCMEDDVIRGFMNRAIYEEIIPTLTLPLQELESFAASVTERFSNPFIDHALLSISLNSTSKWKARVLPSLKAFQEQTGNLPDCLTASFAFYLAFYHADRLTEEGLLGHRRKGDEYLVSDDRKVLEFFASLSQASPEELVLAVCRRVDFWDMDLTLLPGFTDTVCRDLEIIESRGAYALMKECADGGI